MNAIAIHPTRPEATDTFGRLARRLGALLRRAFELAGAPYSDIGYRYL
ncbi:hypothetical protein MasN3_29230 [Massilia varians]|uniref:MarR family transcriptional regulator n=1 Tax=Massilia varians TaxID=457921 RepID=A0ABM8C830_9BURK|nr:hypothetical protein [Massilia varians]BDT59429.1 hypothetical protein MasN3_29230 [Massilia varians]